MSVRSKPFVLESSTIRVFCHFSYRLYEITRPDIRYSVITKEIYFPRTSEVAFMSVTLCGTSFVPNRFKKRFTSLSFIKTEMSGISETKLISGDGNIVFESVSVVYVLTRTNTRPFSNKYLRL